MSASTHFFRPVRVNGLRSRISRPVENFGLSAHARRAKMGQLDHRRRDAPAPKVDGQLHEEETGGAALAIPHLVHAREASVMAKALCLLIDAREAVGRPNVGGGDR